VSASVKSKSSSHNGKRRILIIVSLLVVVLVCSLFVYTLLIDKDGFVHVKNEAELRQAISDVPFGESGVIIFDRDITLAGTIIISVGSDITLRSKGDAEFFKLIGANSVDAIRVTTGGILQLDGIIVTPLAGGTGGGVQVLAGGTLIMTEGKIIGNGVSNEGTFVLSGGEISDGVVSGVSNMGTFTMSGGKICNIINSYSGGGVFNRGVFVLSGGEIFGNTAEYGGGVYNVGTFEMTGGEIFGNTAEYGGGFFSRWSDDYSLIGGDISGNTATYGSNVYTTYISS